MHYDRHYLLPAKVPSSSSFTSFSKLPPEIRTMIWTYSLPSGRVYEILDTANAKQRQTPAHRGLMFANIHQEPPPALAFVCREARSFVLHSYKPLTLSGTTKFVDLSRDILLLEPYLLVKRLHRVLHFMTQIPLVRDGIKRLALGTSYGVYTGICHPLLSWKVAKGNMGKMLTALGKFPQLKTLVFVVHQEFQFEFDFRGGERHGYDAGPPPLHQIVNGGVATAAPRPQVVHQAYRFKFDIEANINHVPRRPHLNELLCYPLDMDEDRDDWDAPEDEEGSEWCDPWPTNDDWRRFRRQFQRAINLALERDYVDCGGKAGCGRESGRKIGGQKARVPGLKGASLLWRYTRGRYV